MIAKTSSQKTSTQAKKGNKSKSRNKNQGAQGSSNGEDKILEKLFIDSLKDMYWAEKALIKALTQMSSEATSSELQQAFEDHKAETEVHAERLEHAFELLGEKAKAKKCEAMEGLIKEGKTIIEETDEGTATRDVGLIMAAQKVEHYEIASYGSLVQLALTMGEHEVADILQETLDEEKECDHLLTEIAESNINDQATQEDKGDYGRSSYGRSRTQGQNQGRGFSGNSYPSQNFNNDGYDNYGNYANESYGRQQNYNPRNSSKQQSNRKGKQSFRSSGSRRNFG